MWLLMRRSTDVPMNTCGSGVYFLSRVPSMSWEAGRRKEEGGRRGRGEMELGRSNGTISCASSELFNPWLCTDSCTDTPIAIYVIDMFGHMSIRLQMPHVEVSDCMNEFLVCMLELPWLGMSACQTSHTIKPE